MGLILGLTGHETTSGTMSFTMYYLLKHPEVMEKLRNEVDEIIGDQPAEVRDLNRMPYLHGKFSKKISGL